MTYGDNYYIPYIDIKEALQKRGQTIMFYGCLNLLLVQDDRFMTKLF